LFENLLKTDSSIDWKSEDWSANEW